LKKRRRDEKLIGAYASANGDWVVIPFTKGWVAAQRLVVKDGTAIVAELRVYPDETPALVSGVREKTRAIAGEWSGSPASVPAGGLTTTLLRRVPTGGHVAAPVLADCFRAWREAGGLPTQQRAAIPFVKAVADAFAFGDPPVPEPSGHEDVSVRRRRGREPLADAFLRGVAADYSRLHEAGHRDVAQRLAEERGANRSTVRTWIRLARARRMLGAAPGPGRGPIISRPPASLIKRRRARPAG
jgi:hypothetical protein